MSKIGDLGLETALAYPQRQRGNHQRAQAFINAEYENIKDYRVSQLALKFDAWNRTAGEKIAIGSTDDFRNGAVQGAKVFLAGARKITSCCLQGRSNEELMPAGRRVVSFTTDPFPFVDITTIQLGDDCLPGQLSEAVARAETDNFMDAVEKSPLTANEAYAPLVFRGKIDRVKSNYSFITREVVDGYDDENGWCCEFRVEVPEAPWNISISVRSDEYGDPFVEPVGSKELEDVLAVESNPSPDWSNFANEKTRCKVLDQLIRGDFNDPTAYWFVVQRETRKLESGKYVPRINEYETGKEDEKVTNLDYGFRLIALIPVISEDVIAAEAEFADELQIREATTEAAPVEKVIVQPEGKTPGIAVIADVQKETVKAVLLHNEVGDPLWVPKSAIIGEITETSTFTDWFSKKADVQEWAKHVESFPKEEPPELDIADIRARVAQKEADLKGLIKKDAALVIVLKDLGIDFAKDKAWFQDLFAQVTAEEEKLSFDYTHKRSITYLKQWDLKDYLGSDGKPFSLGDVNADLKAASMPAIWQAEYDALLKELK